MTEKLRVWLRRGLSEARGPDDADRELRMIFFHADSLCLHVVISSILPALMLGITALLWHYLIRSSLAS